MNHLRLTRDALDVGKISDMVSSESCGAISLFVGTTRDSFEGKNVLSLEYEAYESMALKQLDQICKDLRRQWPDIKNIAIFHRLGLVKIREASVVIAISSPHRESSLDAVKVAIDELKRMVPIWKKEIYEGEDATWKENKESGVVYHDKSNAFNESMCFIEDRQPPPCQFVQISVSEDEMKRRIQCFIEKKRNEIDLNNIMDFTDVNRKEQGSANPSNIKQEEKENPNESMTCARVNSFVIKQEYSKCHLKVKRVENNIGPQIQPDYLNTLDKLMVPVKKDVKSNLVVHKKEGKKMFPNYEESYILKYPTISERLENIEQHLSIPQSEMQNIYQRLKTIEDRLLFLESISPEYAHFLVEKFQVINPSGVPESLDTKPTGISAYERNQYSVSEIEAIVQSFEERNPNLEYHQQQ